MKNLCSFQVLPVPPVTAPPLDLAEGSAIEAACHLMWPAEVDYVARMRHLGKNLNGGFPVVWEVLFFFFFLIRCCFSLWGVP